MYSLGTMNRNNNLILSMQKIEGRCRHPVVPTRFYCFFDVALLEVSSSTDDESGLRKPDILKNSVRNASATT